jgi:hypothetical protein
MQNRTPTKKAAAVKRKTVTPKSQNVADLPRHDYQRPSVP